MNNKSYNKSSINKTNDKGISNERSFTKILNHKILKIKSKIIMILPIVRLEV